MSSIMIFMLLPFSVMAQNYCSICQDHTMCKYQGFGPTCGSDSESGVSHAEIQEILKLHNVFRARVALGKENRGFQGPQPQAANMHAFVWDTELAAVAQKWADQCTFQHDKCRIDPRFSVGQNIYFSSGFSKVNWTSSVSAWYEEVTKFDPRFVNSYEFQPMTSHYTQLVWGNTRYIGCGKMSYGGYYRVKGYQPKEYILSSTPGNDESLTYNKNKESTEKSSTTNQSTEENTSEQITTEEIESLASVSVETISPTSSQTFNKTETAENSTDKVEQNVSENENNWQTQSDASQSQSFAIYIPGYWISNSQPVKNGLVAGVFKSLDFLESTDMKQFFQKIPFNRATEIKSENPLLGYGKFDYNQMKWEENTLAKFGRDQILVCNYGPSGNYLNQPVYIEGEPCSLCPLESVCVNGLCT